MKTNSTGCLTVIVAATLLLGLTLAVYIAGRMIPLDTSKEGPWPENYPW